MQSPDQIINGVRYLSPRKGSFSSSYVKLREKEGRILDDNEVRHLPETDRTNPNWSEWLLRKRSTDRFLKYLKSKEKSLTILDVGCGNGWFSHKMATLYKGNSVVGLDINEVELEQAVRVFNSHNIEFVYGDIFNIDRVFDNRFDIITLNASIQYFNDPGLLFNLLNRFLRDNGEIHVLDSPFYKETEIDAARKRTIDYYTNMGFPEMSDHYYHHSFRCLKGFKVIYRPPSKLIRKVFGVKDSPFQWLRYRL